MRKKFIHVVVDGDFCVNMTNPDAMMHNATKDICNATASTEMPPRANGITFFTSTVVFALKINVWLLKHFILHFRRLITCFQLKLALHVVVF